MLGKYDFSDEKLIDSFGIQLQKLQEEIEKLLEGRYEKAWGRIIPILDRHKNI